MSEGGTFRKRKVTFGVINTNHYFRFAKGSLAEDGRQVVAKGVLQEVGFCRQRQKKCAGASREPAKSRIEVVGGLDESSP